MLFSETISIPRHRQFTKLRVSCIVVPLCPALDCKDSLYNILKCKQYYISAQSHVGLTHVRRRLEGAGKDICASLASGGHYF